MRISTISFAASLFLLGAQPVEAVRLHGTVMSPAGPVAGSQVLVTVDERLKPIRSLAQTTGGDGAFSFTFDVVAGEHVSVLISALPPAGVAMSVDSVGFLLRGDTEVRLRLQPLILISGTVPGAAPDTTVEIASMSGRGGGSATSATPGFTFEVPADVYALIVREPRHHYLARRNVDARSGTVTGIEIPLPALPQPLVSDQPPDASKISVAAPDENGIARIRGAPGSADALSAITITNLKSLTSAFTISASDGSFTADLFAPPGSLLLVRCDRTGRFLFTTMAPATILSVPERPGKASVISFISSSAMTNAQPEMIARIGSQDPGRWVFEADWPGGTWTPGTTAILNGKLTVHSKNLEAVQSLGDIRIGIVAGLDVLFDRFGVQRKDDYRFMSSVMTPTGLPIELPGTHLFPPGRGSCDPLVRRSPERVETTCRIELDLPATLSPALYQPTVFFNVTGIPSEKVWLDAPQTFAPGSNTTFLPPIAIGTIATPRLFFAVLMDQFSDGTRGTVAIEDRGRFSFASHVKTSTPRAVVPRLDTRTGAARVYRLEPFVPMIASSPGVHAEAPRIPFRFPSGSLRVRIHKPDGTTEDLGEASFRQPVMLDPSSRAGFPISSTTKRVVDVYQLTTNDPRFRYSFAMDGLHRVEMHGTIEDVYGRTYTGGGTYEVEVGRQLDIDAAVVAGTPFTAGDHITPAIRLDPAVPAEVEVTLDYWPDSDRARRRTHTWRGRANRFGHFTGDPFLLGTHGEYRIDVRATWTSPEGSRWAGEMTAGSVVATPGSPIVLHGRRGFDIQPVIGKQWLFVREEPASGGHLMFPFHSGDVMWLEDTGPGNIGGTAATTMFGLQDNIGTLAARVRARQQSITFTPPSLETRITAGEIPIVSSSADGSTPSDEEGRTDQWGYVYASAQRPGVHARELIVDDMTSTFGYWRFSHENYQFQLGVGIDGDLANDFKFQFGGAVWRDLSDGFRYYGAYGSLFVLLPKTGTDQGRIFPPFRGNGGGPDGGPIFTLRGKAIDIFFHPTAIRAGTILHRGERASFAGYSAPTLPSRIEITVTAPSGSTRTIRGQADPVGWFYDPAGDFNVSEAGVWKAKTKITFDGRTSAGQVTGPFPTGDVLGSLDGEFWFYVVEPDARPLEVAGTSSTLTTSAAGVRFVRPADAPVRFDIPIPVGLTGVELHTTVAMPGFILEETRSTPGTFSPSLAYVYDAQKLARDFPNLDLVDSDGYAGVDTITISFLLSGTDAAGVRRHFARQIVIQGEELQMPEQKETIIPPRRRSVRR